MKIPAMMNAGMTGWRKRRAMTAKMAEMMTIRPI
jgi:hypothetical protein